MFSSPPTAPSSGSHRAAASTNPGTVPIYLSAFINSDLDVWIRKFFFGPPGYGSVIFCTVPVPEGEQGPDPDPDL